MYVHHHLSPANFVTTFQRNMWTCNAKASSNAAVTLRETIQEGAILHFVEARLVVVIA